MRSLASIVLGFEALLLALVTPVMISVADVRPGVAVPVCIGLAVLAIVAAGGGHRPRPPHRGSQEGTGSTERLGSAPRPTSRKS